MDKRVATGLIVGGAALMCALMCMRPNERPRARTQEARVVAREARAPSRREEILAHQRTRDPLYDARSDGEAAVAVHAPSRMTVRVTDEEARFDAGAHSAGLHLVGVGRADGVGVARGARAEVSGNDVRLARGDVIEWYANGPLGVEQGFEISTRPMGDGALRVELEVRGLTPTLEGTHVALRDARGEERLRYSDLFAYDAEGDDLVARLEVSESRIALVVDDADAAYPVVVDPLVTALEGRLDPNDDAAGHRFGTAVSSALSGSELCGIVGTPQDDRVGPAAGAAYVIRRSASAFTVVTRLQGSDAAAMDGFGSAVEATSITGGCRYVVGAPGKTGGGKVYVFDHVLATGVVTEIGAFRATAPASGDEFGAALASHTGGFLFAGAPGEAGGGAVYYQRVIGTTLQPLQRLVVAGLASGDRFGSAITAAANVVFVGAPSDDTSSFADAGSVFSFSWDGTTYHQESKVFANPAEANARFGASIADVSASRIVVGEPGRSNATGAVWDVGRADGVLSITAEILPVTAPATGDQLGAAVSVLGSNLLVGSPFDDTGFVLNHGSVRRFTSAAGGAWTEVARHPCGTSSAGDNCGAAVSMAVNGATPIGLFGEPLDDTDSASAGAVTVRNYATDATESVLLPNGTFENAMGAATAIDGDTAVIGATEDDDAGNDAGAVYVFVRNAGTWSLQAKLTVPNSQNQHVGGALALSGNTLVVGSAQGVSNRGYVFTRTGTVWSTATLIIHASIAAGNQFGYDVGVSGNTLAFGAPGVNGGGADRGAVMVYTGSGGTWTHQQTLTAAGLANNDYFGRAVDVEGDLLVAGAPGKDPLVGANTDVGAAMVFARTGTTWTEQPQLAGVSGNGAAFGAAVDLHGMRVVVGAPGRVFPAAAVGSGAVRTFLRSGLVWNTESTLTLPSPVVGDELGASVALTDQLLLAGAPGRENGALVNAGVVAPFVLVSGTWTAQTVMTAPAADADDEDAYGRAVALAEQLAVTGAPGSDAVSNEGGAAYAHLLTKQNGDLCTANAECGSGFCVDGRCCGTACGGGTADCRACSLEAGGTNNGVCTSLSAAAAPTITCRASNGSSCDPAETCQAGSAACPADVHAMNGTTCGGAPNGLCDTQDTCQAGACMANFVSQGTTCRGTNGNICDVAEVCSGASAACPADAFATNGTACGGAPSGLCDAQDTCQAGACAPTFAPQGTTCRGTNGNACDVAEVCSGASAACPADALAMNGTTCGGAPNGACDVQDTCEAGACVARLAEQGEPCRASKGVCDVAEACTGASAACPTDLFAPDDSVCDGELVDVCDAPDICAAGECIARFQDSGAKCREADDECDVAEFCTGASVACPADALVADGTACGDAPSGDCDAQDACKSGACTAVVQQAGTTCRSAKGECDVAEVCDGSDTSCPSDVLAQDGDVCGAPVSGLCDAPDLCKEGTCVARYAQAGSECRASTGDCDAEELCSGASTACPPDATGCCTVDADCSDGSTCTMDACEDGLCVVSETIEGCCDTAADCDDADACTTDACLVNACSHTPIPLCGVDAGVPMDAGMEMDASVPEDASAPEDAAAETDAGADAASADAGADAGMDPSSSGGCGCSTAGAPNGAPYAGLLLVVALVARRLRRR